MNSFSFWTFKFSKQKVLAPSTKHKVAVTKQSVLDTSKRPLYPFLVLALYVLIAPLNNPLAQAQSLPTPEIQKIFQAVEAYEEGRFEKASEQLQRLKEVSATGSSLAAKIDYYWTRSQVALDSANIEPFFTLKEISLSALTLLCLSSK